MVENTSGREFSSVMVRNNGLTSFVPPCFSWELIDKDSGKILATASDIVVSNAGLKEFDREQALRKLYEGGVVDGHLEPLPAHEASGAEGVLLVVSRIY